MELLHGALKPLNKHYAVQMSGVMLLVDLRALFGGGALILKFLNLSYSFVASLLSLEWDLKLLDGVIFCWLGKSIFVSHHASIQDLRLFSQFVLAFISFGRFFGAWYNIIKLLWHHACEVSSNIDWPCQEWLPRWTLGIANRSSQAWSLVMMQSRCHRGAVLGNFWCQVRRG